jgi:hypothetical protein
MFILVIGSAAIGVTSFVAFGNEIIMNLKKNVTVFYGL